MDIYQVDAFTDRIFKGNPAGVCILDRPADACVMQDIAAEMNLSETSFLTKNDDVFDLRWFTPEAEVELCGHGTLAAAHILWSEGMLRPDEEAVFDTKSGRLKAVKSGDGIVLDFPAEIDHRVEMPDLLAASLGVDAVYAGRNRMDYIVEIENEEELIRLAPDYGKMEKLDVRGVIVTCRSHVPGYDFASRFFAPRVGVPEDPVTGSSHCCLGPYWMKRLSRKRMTAYQASKRGGTLGIHVEGSRVHISGKAVTVFKISLLSDIWGDITEAG